MITRSFALGSFACLSVLAVLAACAAEGDDASAPDMEGSTIPEVDAGSDALAETGDSGPCEDCEYFPDTCSADVLCPNELFAASGTFDLRNSVNVIRGRSANDVWLGASVGAAAHFDGASWTRADVERESIRAFWLREDGEISFPALDRPFSRGMADVDGGASGDWVLRATPTSPPEYGWWIRLLNATWANAGSEWTWAATEAVSCSHVTSPSDRPPCLTKPELRTSGLWRLRRSADGALEVASVIPHDVCQVTSCEGMTSLHGASANAFWAVGYTGAAIRITDPDSQTPTLRRFNTQTWLALNGVWAASETEAWAVGAHGTIRHYTGDPVLWEVVSNVPVTRDLKAVWGTSSSDVWAVGDAGVVLHYDGKAWTRVKVAGLGARRPNLTTVWLASPGHVWIGGQGVVLSLGGKP